jgi:hypothetical protein
MLDFDHFPRYLSTIAGGNRGNKNIYIKKVQQNVRIKKSGKINVLIFVFQEVYGLGLKFLNVAKDYEAISKNI